MSFKSLGFQKTRIKNIFYGLVIGFIVMFLGFFSLLLFGQIIVKGYNNNIIEILTGIGLFIIVAITEELLVRGYVLNNLLGSINKYYALIISAIIFSALHLGNPHINLLSLINLFLAGVLLGLPYIYNKNLWFSIALHFSWNFCQGTVFGFNVSGNNFYSIILQRISHPNIWNGGSFGFEGSILCVLLQFLAICVVFIIFYHITDKILKKIPTQTK